MAIRIEFKWKFGVFFFFFKWKVIVRINDFVLFSSQELPKAEALLSGREMNENDMQSLDDTKNNKDVEAITTKSKASESDSDASSTSDSSFSDDDESDELNRIQIKMPLELSLSDLAHQILQQNQKSRMNCVIERRRAEELVDGPPKMMQLPFGVALNMEPKKRRVTGERMAIFCESGNGLKWVVILAIANMRNLYWPINIFS